VTPSSKPRVAVIEDSPDTRFLVAMLLGSRFALDEYATGRAALDGMQVNPPAVALLDVSLPDMDGTAVLATMRGDPALASIPAIAFTAHTSAADRTRLLAHGFDAHLGKPIESLEAFVALISRFARASTSGTSQSTRNGDPAGTSD